MMRLTGINRLLHSAAADNAAMPDHPETCGSIPALTPFSPSVQQMHHMPARGPVGLICDRTNLSGLVGVSPDRRYSTELLQTTGEVVL